MKDEPPRPRIPRAARGPRPVFGEGGEPLNQLLAAVTALTAEVATLRQRLVVLESLMTSARVIDPGAVDRHLPDAAMRDEQAHWNEALLQRVFYRYVETPE